MRKTIILDVDDMLYRMDCGLHDLIKARICGHANRTPGVREKAQEWLGADRDFRKEDLGIAFPLIVMQYKKQSPEDLENYLSDVYGNDYGRIAPDPELVSAIGNAEAEGMRIVIYSNGPSSPDPAKDFHVQHVLRRLGFDEDFVGRMRTNSYDLLMSVEAGAGKPSPQGLHNFLRRLNVDPQDSVFLDDSVKNLLTGVKAGIKGIWVWTTKALRPAADVALAKDAGIINADTPAEAVKLRVPRGP